MMCSKYNSFGMAKALHRRIISCEKMCCTLTPINFNSCVFLKIEAVISLTSPVGDPSKVASQRSMNWALGNSTSMSEQTYGSLVTTSVFAWFSFRPSSSAACSKCLTSQDTSARLPPKVTSPSSQYVFRGQLRDQVV